LSVRSGGDAWIDGRHSGRERRGLDPKEVPRFMNPFSGDWSLEDTSQPERTVADVINHHVSRESYREP
jgi:hypothetical protein